MKTPALTPTPNRFGTIRDDFDRLLERFMYPSTLAMRAETGTWSPSIDFSETEKEYVVRLEAPGIAKDQIEVKLEGDLLTLRGERHTAKEEKGEQFFWREREDGTFLRTLRLPTPVDAAAVVARMEDGVLTVTLPKASPVTSSRIPVK